jgi:hypothetical protein
LLGDAVRELADAFDAAHLEHLDALSVDNRTEHDEDDEEIDDETELPVSGSGVTVLLRRDYVVLDADELISAGRDTYRQVWGGRPQDVRRQVPGLGAALYEIMHIQGPDALDSLAQLQLTAAVGVVHSQADPLDEQQLDAAEDDDADPASASHGYLDLFRTDGEIYYSFSEIG